MTEMMIFDVFVFFRSSSMLPSFLSCRVKRRLMTVEMSWQTQGKSYILIKLSRNKPFC